MTGTNSHEAKLRVRLRWDQCFDSAINCDTLEALPTGSTKRIALSLRIMRSGLCHSLPLFTRTLKPPASRGASGRTAEPAAAQQQARRHSEEWSRATLLSIASRVSIVRGQRATPGGVIVPLYEPQV